MAKRINSIKELEDAFNNIPDEATFIEVFIEMPTLPEYEVIKNPIANLSKKLEYYKGAYNDDLTMKAVPAIKIVGVDFGFSMYKNKLD